MNSHEVLALAAVAGGLVVTAFVAERRPLRAGPTVSPQVRASSTGPGATRGIARRRRWAAAWRSG